MKKINATPAAMDNVINTVTSNLTKSKKSGKPVQSESVAVTRQSSKERFIAYVCTKEEIGLNKFFKLFEDFKLDDPSGFKDYLYARKMDINVNYTYKWFSLNCPAIKDVSGKKKFARWVKVTDKNPKSENPEYNRISLTGVEYTLKPYNCFKASYEQYEAMLNHVVREMRRREKESEAAQKANEKSANKDELIKAKKAEIARMQAQLLKLETA